MRKYGYIPSPQLLSYKQFSATKYNTEAELPGKVDLRQYCSPINDQGQQGSCTAHAIVGLREYMEIKDGKTLVPLSRAFLYYEERLKEGTNNQDSGAMPVDGMNVLKTIGVCPESEMPYSDQDYTAAPTNQDINDAAPYKVDEYHSVSSTALMKASLAEDHPVVIGIQVYESFESDAVTKTGIVPVPDVKKEQLLGGHALLVVGYDMQMTATDSSGHLHTEYFIVRNSWGDNWGDKGYCYIPMAYFWQQGLCSDMWVGTIATTKGGETIMTWQELEKQILELLVTLIQNDGSELAQQFLNNLVKIIEQYIPNAGLSNKDKISWVDIRNAMENVVEQSLLQAIADLIALFQTNVN